jgi:hypothetical protein
MKKVLFLAAVIALSSISAFGATCASFSGGTLATLIAAGSCDTTTLTGGGTVTLGGWLYNNTTSVATTPADANNINFFYAEGGNSFTTTFTAADNNGGNPSGLYWAAAAAGAQSYSRYVGEWFYTVSDSLANNRFLGGQATLTVSGVVSVDDPTENNNTNYFSASKIETTSPTGSGITGNQQVQSTCGGPVAGNCPNAGLFTNTSGIGSGGQQVIGVTDSLSLEAFAGGGSSSMSAQSIGNTLSFSTGVPEPMTFFSLGSGLLALGLIRRFKK